MDRKYVTPLREVLEPAWRARFEQVQLEVERNFSRYPQYHEHFDMYHDCIDVLHNAHPDMKESIERLVSAMHLYYSDLALEAYKQGAKDWTCVTRWIAGCDAVMCEKEDVR